jgi:hypothetical protein
MLCVIDHFSNFIWLLALSSKKAVISIISSVLTDIANLHSLMHPTRAFRPTIKFGCDPNYLDVACRSIVSSLGYTPEFTAPYTHNQLANTERQWATLADSAAAMLQHANFPTKY